MRKFLTIVFLLAFVAWNSYGQVASAYSFGSAVGAYTEITGGIVWQTGAWDDQTSSTIPVGFSFTANGSTSATIFASANGYLTKGTASLGYAPISSTGAAPFVAAGFARDLQGVAGSEIRYQTTGTTPNQVFTMQWKNCKRYGSTGTGDVLNFQIKLYETSNQIQIIYGSYVVGSSTSTDLQVGLRGITNADYFNRTTTTNWSASTAGAANNAAMTLSTTVFPANGLTFTYNLIPPGVAVIGSPANGGTGILPDASLNWTPGLGGPPSGYTVYFGTDNPPTNIANGVVVTSPTYNPTPDMLLNTTYYWQVVPFNGGGVVAGAPVWSFTTLAGYGTISGLVLNCNGLPVAGATVVAQGPAAYTTTSAANGSFQFVNVPASVYTLGAQLATYNTVTVTGVVVVPATTTNQNITLTQPALTIPSPYNAAVNPNEYLMDNLLLTNAGCGPVTWTASIAYGSANHDWFSMPTLTGSVPAASFANVPVIFNADGLATGTVLSATVTFTTSPNIGNKVVQVNMVVVGDVLVPVTNLQATLTNTQTGAVTLTWDCTPGAGFLYYTVSRDGVQIALIPAALTYSEVLPGFGTYDYCVAAVYTNGSTVPECVSVEWPNPTMVWTPAALAATVFSTQSAIVNLFIGNTGDGTLAFDFPDWSDNSGDAPLAYCAASGGCDEFISNVNFGTINNSSACSNYISYTALSTDVVKGLGYPISVSVGPPSYGGDVTGVWIDFNHNDTFDASEYTQLTGVTPATGTIAIPAGAMSGPTTMRIRVQWNGTPGPCGTQTYGEVEDYTVVIKAPTFITAVVPASGLVAQHTNAADGTKVKVTFSAIGDYAAAGVYVNQLALTSNDPLNPAVSIPCTMTVIVPGTISGVVTDGVTGEVLPGVMVTAGVYSAMTGDNGEYSFLVAPSATPYVLNFSKSGYQPATASATAIANTIVTVNAQLFEAPYAPSCASAVVNADDTQCVVTWCVPSGPYELLYDDGSAENYAAWQLPGNVNAVKFTPKGYPAKVVGAKLYIGDGSFPAGGEVLGSTFGVVVYTAAANGMPGTMIDSTGVTVTALGWVNVTGLGANITSGDFFIGMVQNTMSPNCAPIGVDETQPKAYKSYSRNVVAGTPWVLSPYQDFMMHAVVSGPMSGDDDAMVVAQATPSKVSGMISQSKPNAVAGFTGMKAMVTAPEGYDNNDAMTFYSLSRIFLGAVTPVAPAAGVFTLISNTLTATTYTESGTTWANLPQGWYAYGVKSLYPAATPPALNESAFVYTNNVPHKMFADVTVNVKLVCGMVPAEGAFVTMTGNDYPFDVLTATVPASGTVVFDNVIKGKYDVLITRAGYTQWMLAVTITGNKTIDAVLEDIKYVPRNLYVECGTLVATWDEPLAYAVQEDFEGGVFPPTGWQATTQGSVGWYAATDGSSAYFTIPPHTTYAVANDDEGGASNDGSVDYLITPELDLTGAPSYVLSFQSFFTGDFGQNGYVEMSTDAGATWTPIYTSVPATNWAQIDIDLSAYSGVSGLASVWFNFHADDRNGTDDWASGWAIDDVVISSGGVPVQGYGVFLDGTLVQDTQELTYTFDPNTITYGQTYVAGVAGIYCSGYSELETYTFTSCFLYPPRNLQATANTSTTSGAVILTWEAPIGGDYLASGSIARTSTPSASAEYSPMVTQHTGDASDAIWDILLQFQCLQAGNAGVETDGTRIYVSIWSGGGFRSFDLAGTFVEEFTIPGVNSIRDLAYNYNNSHMYGSNNSNTLYEMDFTNKVLVGSVSAPGTTIRHIAYNENLDGGNGGFYVGEWASLRSIKMDGSLIANAAGFGLAGCYGSAYDPEGNKIWMFDQGGNGIDLVELDAETMVATGMMHDASLDLGIDAIAGGLAYTHLLVSGQFVMLGLGQDNAGAGDFVFEYDMGESTIGPPSLGNLVGYRMYRNDVAIVPDIPATELEYWDLNLMPATYCYDITAVYDLTPYGMPGMFGESVKEGTACVNLAYGFELPFMEDWTTGQFDVNYWTVGPNWIMDGQAGNLLPSAKFKWDPLLTDYSSSLESFYMNATTVQTTTPYKIWLDFDLKLDDRTASTNEKLAVEVWNGSSWNTVMEYANNGDFGWGAEPEHINISTGAKNKVFKVRFRANGDLSGDIFYWAVDNIHIYVGYEFNPPLNLVATREGAPENDIKLTWDAPEGGGGGTVMSYILDDNSAENGVYFTAAGEGWLGNEFPVTDAGLLQSASVFMDANGSATYSIDIFDASQTLVGSSATFVPTFGDWTTVALPDIAFDGTFYVMLHMVVATQSDLLALDENGPYSAQDLEWYYDGAAFAKLTDFGFPPSVTFVRATGLVGDKKTQVTFSPSTVNSNYVSPLAGTLASKPMNVNTGTAVATASPVNDNSDALVGYNVWRRAYAVFPAGGNTAAAGTWEQINTAIVIPNEYLDMNLSNLVTNCYEYQVTAEYDEGSSVPTNIDWDCIFTGINPKDASEVKVYPNPATTYVRIDLTKEVTEISVYNSLGSIVTTKNVKGETTITLNTNNYAAGAYSVKFTTTSGDSFSRKFVVTK